LVGLKNIELEAAAVFIGHSGVAFGAKPAAPFAPLWVCFLAVQWLDVVGSILVLLGIEKLRIVPGITEANAYDLYYMPYTHGLPGTLALSLLFGAVVAILIAEKRATAFVVVSLVAFSHWVLDLLVHIPDLPLYDDSAKVGFGLWRHLAISFPLEIGLLVAGAWIYAQAVPAGTARGCNILCVIGTAGLRQFRAPTRFGIDGDHGSCLLSHPRDNRGARRTLAPSALADNQATARADNKKPPRK
jgi:hypothetical protein